MRFASFFAQRKSGPLSFARPCLMPETLGEPWRRSLKLSEIAPLWLAPTDYIRTEMVVALSPLISLRGSIWAPKSWSSCRGVRSHLARRLVCGRARRMLQAWGSAHSGIAVDPNCQQRHVANPAFLPPRPRSRPGTATAWALVMRKHVLVEASISQYCLQSESHRGAAWRPSRRAASLR